MIKSAQRLTRGFTLVELLVVIAIIAILAAVVVLIINPVELTKRGRDAARLSDLANLQNAINVAVQESTQSGVVAVLCADPADDTYPCEGRSNADGRKADGTGWVKVNLTAAKGSVSVPTLPADPVDSEVSHYTYCADDDAWEIVANLESVQQVGKEGTDGGNDPDLYEVGSNLNLVGLETSDPARKCAY